MADPHQYCTANDLALRISQEGLTLRIDDDPTSADDCINEATATIDTYIGVYYPPQYAAQIPIVTFICRCFAVYFLCLRRNETPTKALDDEMKRYMKMLEDIAAGILIPIELPRPPGGAAVSNQTYDLERYPQIGVEKPRSTNLTTPGKRNYDANSRPYFGPFLR